MQLKLSELKETGSKRDHGDISGLKQSIKEVGLINPITINQDKRLIAGRRRFQAIKELGWKEADCRILPSNGNLFDFKVAIEENLKRKSLTDLEVANSIKEYDELKRKMKDSPVKHGGDRKSSAQHNLDNWTYDDTAKDFGISESAVRKSIEIAKAVEDRPELAKLKSGEKILREQKRTKLKTQPLPDKKFRVIYADPPWQFANSGFSESAETHYPTMPTDEICLMPIETLCTKQTVLFIWATNAMLEDALRVIKEWGFKYKSNLVWIKDKGPSIGWFVQSRHELLLIATREENMHPNKKPLSWFKAEVSKHSKKPEVVYKTIETMYEGPYIELFARNTTKGWDNYGNEIPKS